MIDIVKNRPQVFDILQKLQATDIAQFGLMTPQHMIEHLSILVRVSNGKMPQALQIPEEKAAQTKQFVIYSENDLPVGFKAPILPKNELLPLIFPDLPSAIARLEKELADFDAFFAQNPSEKPINPTMGALTKQEWIVFHNKHFKHHFKQFNLL
ncbi:MAG: DUF1569 domain-containing protein [Chitinophagales bacterium]|nr:DUF1569 domain-containing protein [Bacteroidota bacterium]MCB9043256.1 DUF1569 domain-containing protein [Chitinophagales bacterium]